MLLISQRPSVNRDFQSRFIVAPYGQVGPCGFPIVTDLREDGRHEPQERCFVWEKRGDACPLLDLLVEPLDAVGRSEPPLGLGMLVD